MSWSVKELAAWLDEVEPHADQRGKFDWLEIPPIASASAIQEAYHAIARTRHPDLFPKLDPRTLDRLVRMYGRVTAAYADLKEPEKCAAYLRELRGPRPQTAPPEGRTSGRYGVPAPPARPEPAAPTGPTRASPITTPPPMGTAAPAGSERPTPPTPPMPRVQRDGPIEPAASMNPRALAFYRRAEGAQKTGDRAAALLQIKMAIAADPKSTFLRAALAELTKS